MPASVETKKTLNKKLREPEKLVLYKHGLYECTMNDPKGRYNQSSLALLLELPQGHTVESFLPITLWIAPAGTTDLDFMSFHNGQPTPDQLKDLGWFEVKIGCAPEQIVVLRGRAHAKRMQYVCVFLASGYEWVTVMHEIPISSAQSMTSYFHTLGLSSTTPLVPLAGAVTHEKVPTSP